MFRIGDHVHLEVKAQPIHLYLLAIDPIYFSRDVAHNFTPVVGIVVQRQVELQICPVFWLLLAPVVVEEVGLIVVAAGPWGPN